MMDLSFLSLGYMQNGLAAALLVGASCAIAGVFIILRHIVFVSMVLAQLAVLGLSVAMYLQLSESMEFAMSFGATLLGVGYLAIFQDERKSPPDALLGMGFAGCHALSLLLLAKSSQGLEEIRHMMSGNLLSVTTGEVQILLLAAIFMFAVHIFGYRSFVFICSDSEFAKVTGKSVKAWELLFYVSLGLVISLSLQMTGIFYVFSCLIFPGMAGLLLGSSFAAIQIISIVFAISTGFLGVWFSFARDFPTSEAIIACQLLFYIVIAAGRAILHRTLSRRRIRIFKRWLRKRMTATKPADNCVELNAR
jgi:ABC-type Mn2+/Zn2+ transport system permease subunit